ncbi:hypothetical protein EDC18_102232 [Natranaerovirga pectinivora]|uniref:Uncharacterized protein n=1 Tax=Natranaerovirga pectinivora TaxID=682400 RepID=A0A4R3MMM9_9FIRM|nr:hypothetical protein EDC18_102232 [Natranaerovirga pectinivora]
MVINPMSTTLRWITFESLMIAISPVYGRGASIFKIQAAKILLVIRDIFHQFL